ncbi:hypothetical protein O181_026258 [Austropuccinia psidii MF-1]|uniref:Uncharacterized protein n=1 Tax=Austropuccinia psidii MF-1 TaxID=1389203 RepID=A0A9Q3CM80_9BASI|nr:hypothetical protein [Austropuccinia psidii MF-1]
MPVQHSPPERQIGSQARAKHFLTPNPRAPLHGTPEVPQLRAHLDRGQSMEGDAPSRREGRGPIISSPFSGVVGTFPGILRTTLKAPGKDGEEEESDGTQVVPTPVGASKADDSNHGQDSRSFKTPSMKAPECFYGTQPLKVRSFIQSCQCIFHNDQEDFSEDRNKILYSTSFLIGRASKLIVPYLSNLTNKDPEYPLNNWALF